jgi:N-acetylmuramoyl-L-alanine amidase
MTVAASVPRASRTRRLKRQMLRDAVADNLATIAGRPPSRLGVRRVRWGVWAAAAGVALLIAGVLQSLSAPRSGARGARLDVLPQARALAVPASAPTLFEAPRAIDPALFHLGIRKVVIDPGHGGSDPGAMTGHVAEKDITLDLAHRLATLLRAAGFTVTLTREGDETLSLQQRVEIANAAEGDLFLSIHVNSIPVAIRRGVETYYLGPATDPGVEKLAGAENSGSGYSLADFRHLLEGVYTDVRQEESRGFALAVQGKLFAVLHRANPDLEDRGVKKAPFVVLVGTQMPSVLAEVSCISNPDELQLLEQDAYRQDIARALAAGVRAYAARRNDSLVARRARRDGGG